MNTATIIPTTVNATMFQPQQEVTFLYTDEAGVQSERTITVDRVGQRHVVGMCHTRNAYRSFNFNRIVMA